MTSVTFHAPTASPSLLTAERMRALTIRLSRHWVDAAVILTGCVVMALTGLGVAAYLMLPFGG